MSSVLSRIILSGLVLLGWLTFELTSPSATNAQCGSIESSCVRCHQEIHPVCGKTEWHAEYGHRYACWHCHGGNDMAHDKALAHVDLARHPLQDAYTSCCGCHPEDYQQLAERFANALGTTVSARAPTPRATTWLAADVQRPRAAPAPVYSATPQNALGGMWLIPVLAVFVSLALVCVVWKCKTA